MSGLRAAAARLGRDYMMRRRIFMAFWGVVICSFSVGFYRLSAFGTDPYQCLAEGVSNKVPLGFGNVLTLWSSCFLCAKNISA